jgi:type III restriction enzyme
MTDPIVNPGALEPLFGPSDLPDKHRVRSKKPEGPAEVVRGRRPSPIVVAQSLRRWVAEWREAGYAGASETSVELLHHWFSREHDVRRASGGVEPFSYYFCQREAIETLIYLHEVRQIRTLSRIVQECGGPDSTVAALGVNPDDDKWAKYAFKLATGAGKTKVMSLAIVWSYFHALRESDSPMARHFVIIAPGITVFERLKEDFGGARIVDHDPLIPKHWMGDWNISVVLQDESSSAQTGAVIYLTNIHRLYDLSTRRSREPETYGFVGPAVSKSKALDTGQALRERITSHPRLMILNDEAHHVWDPGSAWSEAISFLHDATRRGGEGIVAQLDFSATPKNDRGDVFQHVVCDTPLGEAVDAGIVKTPIIGQAGKLVTRAHQNAGYKYEQHLRIGYERWVKSKEEWDKSGKKALLFVMTESTDAADQIAGRLNSDPVFAELNGKTINLHTNLKGKLKKRGRGDAQHYEFIEDEKAISDEDLKQLRRLSRELDDSTSPYRCIVSVLMLREGWDVRNVTTIIPLRPLTAESKILPEQTLGRGLRRMTPPGRGEAAEVVTVVEHRAFASLYQEELSQEGLFIEAVDVDRIPQTTVTIYPDATNKDLVGLDLLIPRLSPAYRIEAILPNLDFEEFRTEFQRSFKPLPLGKPTSEEIRYEGRHLITNEVVEQMNIKLALLADGIGAISFFREELERAARIRGQHAVLAPLIQRFLEEVLFGEVVTVYDPRVLPRLADADVRENIRGTFLPILLREITRREQRIPEEAPQSVCSWKPYQATHTERRPAKAADKTPFNLVPCSNELEVAMTQYLDFAEDVAAFARNAGPQALRADFIGTGGHRAIYTPDFLVRKVDGSYLLVETKGRVDRDVPAKARAAVEWCKAASGKRTQWDYVYVPQDVFEQVQGNSVVLLARACAPALAALLREAESPQLELAFAKTPEARLADQLKDFIDPAAFAVLPPRYQKAVEHAVSLFHFHERKETVSFAPVFQPLLGPIDHAAESLLLKRLSDKVPAVAEDQKQYFAPDLTHAKSKHRAFLAERCSLLKRLLVHRSPIMPVGLLAFCLDYASKADDPMPGVLAMVRASFANLAASDLRGVVARVYDFRNTYIAHEKQGPMTSAAEARVNLRTWLQALAALEHSLQ